MTAVDLGRPVVGEVVDESDGTVYLFSGVSPPEVDRLIERWSTHGEPTWVSRRQQTADDGFSIGDAMPIAHT